MSRPSWQVTECPAWCVVEHQEDDHPDDRTHRDAGVDIPVVTRRRHYERDELVADVECGYFTLGRWQRDGEHEVWISLGDNDSHDFEVGRDSFLRLIRAMEVLGLDIEVLRGRPELIGF